MDKSKFEQYKVKNFFGNEKGQFRKLLQDDVLIWELIPMISTFLDNVFSEGILKGNYSENVYISPTATVDKTARIIGPAIISASSQVRFNAYIRENVIVGEDSIIGHASEIKNSLLMYHTTLSHFNLVEDSILGDYVRLGAGAITANRRLDRANIMLKIDDEKIDTGLTRLGVIIGDTTRVGVNAVFNPGTIIGKKNLIFPLTSVLGTHPDNSIIK